MEAMGEKDGNTLSAILLGEKSGMDPEMKELYQVSGIGHILAISGLHLSLIGLGAYRVLRREPAPLPCRRLRRDLLLGLYVRDDRAVGIGCPCFPHVPLPGRGGHDGTAL